PRARLLGRLDALGNRRAASRPARYRENPHPHRADDVAAEPADMSMDRHDIIAAQLEEYAFGQLARDDKREVEAHMRDCPECRTALDELLAVMAAIGS